MKAANITAAAAAAAALICALGWLYEHQLALELRRAQVADTLDPVAEMLKENAAISQELRSAPDAAGDADLVSAYLLQIRRDGVPRHSDIRQRLDRLNDNNTAILALLAKYSTHARTPAFRASVERFRDYAITFRDRWQSVPEIFMAGGNLPVAGPLFPPDFPQAIAAEAR